MPIPDQEIMKRILIRNSNENVRVKIKQIFSGFGIYAFVKNPTSKEIYQYDQQPKIPFPHEFVIGKGCELKKKNLKNNWEITLLNLSKKELKYSVSFEWYQGKDKKPFYTWPEKEEDKKGVLEQGKHVSMRGMFRYI